MIKVIKEGTRNRIECDYCGALLAYEKVLNVKMKLLWRELDNEFSVN